MVSKVHRSWIAVSLFQTLLLPSVYPLLADTDPAACRCTANSCVIHHRAATGRSGPGASAYGHHAHAGHAARRMAAEPARSEAEGAACHQPPGNPVSGPVMFGACSGGSPAAALPKIPEAARGGELTSRSPIPKSCGDALSDAARIPPSFRPEPPTPPPRSI
jgi:hypothetical protein